MAASPGFAEESRRLFGASAGGGDPLEVVRRGAEELVARAFIQPLFKMMRDDPLRSDFIPQSQGEKTFGPLLDAELSKRMVRAARFDLVEAVARELLPDSVTTDYRAASAPNAQMETDTYA